MSDGQNYLITVILSEQGGDLFLIKEEDRSKNICIYYICLYERDGRRRVKIFFKKKIKKLSFYGRKVET